ncbi:MAG: sulfatase-like hydrolase/transferase [Planctomycetota bacterium]|nr:sulfatase-like hydrolase/transferase [Planctomycetota bacterium]
MTRSIISEKFSAFFLLCMLCSTGFTADKPNIIIFLADDLGYADIGVNGCKDIPTPNIDGIANSGVRFTDGYATHCVCSPSRAGLMSGMYQHRFGFEHNSGPERFADPNFGQPREVPTLAEKLKGAGYATGMIGKWHIGFKEGLRPQERGFDYHYGFLSGAHTYLAGRQDNDPIVRNGQPVKTTKYLTDEFADEAVGFVERSKDKPFFLYFAFNAVHSPMDENAYQDRFPELAGKRKIFAGMLTALDTAIGRVMTKVKEIGQEDNTLVIFYSDNGGPTSDNSSLNTPLRGFKAQMFEGGIRVPFVMQWKGKIPSGRTYREMVMGFDCHTTALAAAGIESGIGFQPVENSRQAGSLSHGALDGVNLIPFINGKQSGRPHEQLFWRAGQQHAARVGDWKLVDTRIEPPMLFNLKEDISESKDLAATQPDKLKELQSAFAEWEKGTKPALWVRQDGRTEGIATKAKGKATSAAGSRIQEALKTADKNGDGKLSQEEYPQPAIFKDVDKDNDGFATREEIQAYYQARRATTKKE